MNSIKKNLLLFIAYFVVTTSYGQMPDWGEPDTLAHHKLGPGIQYSNIYFTGKKMLIWVTEVDLTHPLNKIEQVQSNHKVPDLVRWTVQEHYKQNSYPGHKVCVAFNHDFFSYDGGFCIGLNISEGEIPYGGGWGRSLLAINAEKKAGVFNPLLNAKVMLPDASELKIDFFNSSADGLAGDCILFNRFNARQLTDAGKYIKLSPKGAWTVNGDDIPCEVLEISDSPIQSSQTEYVLYLRGSKTNAMNTVAIGDTIHIAQQLQTSKFGQPLQNILNAFHGYPSIAFEGKLHEGEYNNFENGREYEISSRVMVGTSEDGNRLYVVMTEMSRTSAGVNCIDLANYMLATGSWNVVNFDSGGSAAIVVDETMLNYPARDAVRPVMDALLAVSLAPESNEIASYGFKTPSIYSSAATSIPLSLLSFNAYDEVLDRDVEGFTFTCIPESLGYVDDDQVLHLGVQSMTGKVIAEKDGKQAELIVYAKPIEDFSINPASILIDERGYPIQVETEISNTIYHISPAHLTWQIDDNQVCRIEDGVLRGVANGNSSVIGQLGDISKSLNVVVEIGKGKQLVPDFSDLNEFSTKMTGVKNLDISNPSDNQVVMNFDFTAGRGPYIDLEKDIILYGLPDSLSWKYVNTDNIFKEFIFTFEDAGGNSIVYTTAEQAAGEQEIIIPFASNGIAWEVPKFPITFKKLKIRLNAAAVQNYTVAWDALYAHYPAEDETSISNPTSQQDIKVGIYDKHLSLQLPERVHTDLKMDLFSLQGSYLQNLKYEITDTYSDTYSMDLNYLEPGIYILKVNFNQQNFIKKIIITQ